MEITLPTLILSYLVIYLIGFGAYLLQMERDFHVVEPIF